MSRRTKVSVATKGLNMSNSDTRTSAGSNKSPNPAGAPASGGKTPEPSPAPGQAAAAKNAGPGPTDLVSPAEKPAPTVDAQATAKGPQPSSAGEPDSKQTDSAPTPSKNTAKNAGPGPTDLVSPAEKPAPTVSAPAATKSTDPVPSPAGNPTEPDAKTVSGGFSGINNWLDSLPEPNWERVGDKIFAAPATLKAKWRQLRIERAKAAELKEQERLLAVARAEAQAEAAKRETTRLAHQAALDAAARDAAEEQRAAQATAAKREAARLAHQTALDAAARDAAEEQRAAQAEARLVAAETARLKTLAQQAKTTTEPAAAATQVTGTVPSRTASAPAPKKTAGPEELATLVASAKAAIDLQQSTVEPVYVAPYTLPDFSPSPAEEPSDLRRRILGAAAAVAGAAVSLAALDTLVSGGVESLGSNYSMLSLAPTAHLIWPVVFLWAVLGAAFSWVPGQRSAVRQRAVGIPFTLACAAAILWMTAALNSWLLPAFIASAASCWFLYTSVKALNRHTARSTVERMLTDAPISLMTGFSLVVLASSFTNLLASWGAGAAGIWVATVLVPAVGYAAVTLTMTERGRIILAIGMGWGMFWLLIPRVLGTNNSIWIAILAGMAGFVVLLATENRRYQIHHAEHRAARGKSTDFD